MKVSYRTHPVLRKLNNPDFGQIITVDGDFNKSIMGFKEDWKENLNEFNKEVICVSESFLKACDKAKNSLSKLHLDMALDGESFSAKGTFCILNLVIMINFEQDRKNTKISTFVFHKDGRLILCCNSKGDDIDGWISKYKGIEKDLLKVSTQYAIMCLNILMFKKYAQVETVLNPAGKTTRDIKCKYVNDTSLDITHLDSTWFTTLIKSEEFTVNGHFRLQPKKKDGVWVKELIWISEFKKTGYTRKAKILNEQQH